MISFKQNFFYLNTADTSYVMRLMDGVLVSAYYGARIPEEDISDLNLLHFRTINPPIVLEGIRTSMDNVPQEMPTFGRGDYRNSALNIEGVRGTNNVELRYVSHNIFKGKPDAADMPAFEADDCETLEIKLADEFQGVEVTLCYSVFEKENVIARRSVVKNLNDDKIKLRGLASLSVDLMIGESEMITFEGGWGHERYINRHPLHQGMSTVESRRGASSHELNPAAIITKKNTTEEFGDCYGFALVYSADFKIVAEVDQIRTTRVQLGINPDTFSWELKSGESFTTPEAVMTFSKDGFNKLSQNFHDAVRKYLGACKDDTPHPLLINNWEAMYMELSEEKFFKFIDNCKGFGIDTLVMDDGWFGERDSDTTSIGDWFVYKDKFPRDLHPVIDYCHKNGMNFGIWVEPEMISRKSKLFEKHPDWCIHEEGRDAIEGRNQLVLDFSRNDVVDGMFEIISDVLSRYGVSYVKWDMNRNINDNGSTWLGRERQGEHQHRNILGVYALMRRLKEAFPHVFFEGCAGGGGRFDFGLLYYMPQIWTSDCSDAIERLKIQYGTTMIYPPACMVGHVSACPNHQTGRTVSFKTRNDVAQMCNFGYELDLGLLSEEERATIAAQVVEHRELEPLIRFGDYYRINSPFLGDTAAWELVSVDKTRAYAMFAFQHTAHVRDFEYLRLKGLDPEKRYLVKEMGKTYSGATLMNLGLPIPTPYTDYSTLVFNLFAE